MANLDKIILNGNTYNLDSFPDEAKEALLQCFENVAWEADDPEYYISALAGALGIGDLRGLSIDKIEAEVRLGSALTLTAEKRPSTAPGTITWSSSNTAVATVVNGVVTPVSTGTAVITASCEQFHASCTVTVMRSLALLSGTHTFDDGSILEISNGNHIKMTFGISAEAQVCLTTLSGNSSESLARSVNGSCTISTDEIFELNNSTLQTTLSKTGGDARSTSCSIYLQPTTSTQGFDLLGSNLTTATKTQTVTGKTASVANIGMWMGGVNAGTTYEADLTIVCDGTRIM